MSHLYALYPGNQITPDKTPELFDAARTSLIHRGDPSTDVYKRQPRTIHAGEAAGPDSMRTALSYGTKRIGHGVAAIEDPELVKRLVEEGITLEVSVTSNYHTKVVDRLEDHPIRRLFDAGVRVTINSDNMTCSRTNVNKELDLMRTVFGFTEEEIKKMEEYAWEARFLKD